MYSAPLRQKMTLLKEVTSEVTSSALSRPKVDLVRLNGLINDEPSDVGSYYPPLMNLSCCRIRTITLSVESPIKDWDSHLEVAVARLGVYQFHRCTRLQGNGHKCFLVVEMYLLVIIQHTNTTNCDTQTLLSSAQSNTIS